MSAADSKDRLEQRLRREAAAMRYPATPDFSGPLRSQKVAAIPRWAAAIILVAIAALAVQPVRAALYEFLSIGAVAIEAPPSQPAPTQPEERVYLLDELQGELSLEAAREEALFDIRLPAWPPDAGEPDRAYLQTVSGRNQFAILVWQLPESEAVDFALYILGPGVAITKAAPLALEELEINGRPAAYVEGGHLLVVQGRHESGALVSGPALIWAGEDEVTYRLESARPLDELIRIAESIK